MFAIQTEGLTKTYKAKEGVVEALKPLDVTIEQGEVFGLLGPNGAGKTTMVKLLLGIVSPSQGRATIMGAPIASIEAKKTLGYLPENHRFPLHLTGRQMLEFYGNLAGMSGKTLNMRIDYLTELVRMNEWLKLRLRQYSKGMLQRVGLAQALLNEPKLLFLDEPTDGIDPVGRKEIRDVLMHVKEQGTTIFVNSHLLSEVELISDRVAILNKGSVVKMGATDELTKDPGIYVLTLEQAQALNVSDIPGGINFDTTTNELKVKAASIQELNVVIDALRQRSILISNMTAKKSTLEELFFEIIAGHQEHLAPSGK